MDTSLKDQAKSRIENAQSAAIVVAAGSNLDGLASGLSLYLSLKKMGKNPTILAKAPTVGDARLLYGVGDIGKPGQSKNLVIGVNKAIENVDKVTYYLEGDVLKIIVHALPDSSGIKKEDLTFEGDYQETDLIIGVGLNSPEDMNKQFVHEQKINPNAFIMNINREKPIKKFAQIDIIDPTSPSLSQITASLLETLGLPLDEDIAFDLYTGIASSTKMFAPNIATPDTLSTSAWLLKLGAGKASLAQPQTQPMPAQSMTNEGEENQMHGQMTQNQVIDQVSPQYNQELEQTPLEEVEQEKSDEKDWLKPPKIYRGSKSFDIES